jgi:hypothetical protein
MNDLLVAPHNLKALLHHIQHVAKISWNIFKMPELTLGVEEAPPPLVVWEGAAAGVEEPTLGALGSLGTMGRSSSCATSLLNFSWVTTSIMY